jgi:hypothetical protein
MKDLQGALSTTLKIYVNLEKIRTAAFNKRVTVQSATTIQKLSNEIESLQSKVETRSKVRKMLPVLSEKVYRRSNTPGMVRSTLENNSNYMKKFIRASNSRLCSSRAGYTERRMEVEVEELEEVSCEDHMKNQPITGRLEELFGKVHQVSKDEERPLEVNKILKVTNKQELLKKSVEALMRRMENPKSTIHRCINSFHEVKKQQNIEFIKRIKQSKKITPTKLRIKLNPS